MKPLPCSLALGALVLLSQCAALGPMPDWDGGPGPAPAYGPYTDAPPPQSHSLSSLSWGASGHRSSPSSTSTSYRRADNNERHPSFPLDGNVTEGGPGSRTYRNRYTGEIIGNEYTSPAGNTTYRDSSGRITGSSSTSPAGTTTYRDSRGAISITSDTTPGTGGDSTTYYRRNGTIVGTKYVSPVGNVTWRDGNGTIINGPNW